MYKLKNMDKHNNKKVNQTMGLVIPLVLIFLTNCKATVKETGFLNLADKYPTTQCIISAQCAGFTTMQAARSLKIHGLTKLGRTGAIVLFSTGAWLYTYDLRARGINQTFKQRQRSVATDGTCARTNIIAGLGTAAMLFGGYACPPVGIAALAFTGISMVASEEARANGH